MHSRARLPQHHVVLFIQQMTVVAPPGHADVHHGRGRFRRPGFPHLRAHDVEKVDRVCHHRHADVGLGGAHGVARGGDLEGEVRGACEYTAVRIIRVVAMPQGICFLYSGSMKTSLSLSVFFSCLSILPIFSVFRFLSLSLSISLSLTPSRPLVLFLSTYLICTCHRLNVVYV